MKKPMETEELESPFITVYKMYKIIFLLNSENNFPLHFPGFKKEKSGKKTNLMIKVAVSWIELHPHETYLLRNVKNRQRKFGIVGRRNGVQRVTDLFEDGGFCFVCMSKVKLYEWSVPEASEMEKMWKLVDMFRQIVRIVDVDT